MENSSSSSNFTLYLMLIVAIMLVTVDTIELAKIHKTWIIAMNFDMALFESCIKWDLITKTCFACFSLMAALSALILTMFLCFSIEFFINKILTTYIALNYFIFGPYMLCFTILGFVYWSDIAFSCDPRDPTVKFFSFSNVLSISACFLIALIVTLAMAFYEALTMIIKSVRRREGGNYILGSIFWWIVFRARANEDNNRNPGQQNV